MQSFFDRFWGEIHVLGQHCHETFRGERIAWHPLVEAEVEARAGGEGDFADAPLFSRVLLGGHGPQAGIFLLTFVVQVLEGLHDQVLRLRDVFRQYREFFLEVEFLFGFGRERVGHAANGLRPVAAAAQLELDVLFLYLDEGDADGPPLVDGGAVAIEFFLILLAVNPRQPVGAQVYTFLGRWHVQLEHHLRALEVLPQVSFTLRPGGPRRNEKRKENRDRYSSNHRFYLLPASSAKLR